jgi:RNA polymerase-binding transcription factor DksA
MERALSADEITSFERRLQTMLDQLIEQVGDIERNTLEPSGDPQGQTDDESAEDAAIERDHEALAAEDQLAYQVRDALQRVVEGSFGICESCGRPIERARLDEVPYTELCAACAQRDEAA